MKFEQHANKIYIETYLSYPFRFLMCSSRGRDCTCVVYLLSQVRGGNHFMARTMCNMYVDTVWEAKHLRALKRLASQKMIGSSPKKGTNQALRVYENESSLSYIWSITLLCSHFSLYHALCLPETNSFPLRQLNDASLLLQFVVV